jgi:hypothetical protein
MPYSWEQANRQSGFRLAGSGRQKRESLSAEAEAPKIAVLGNYQLEYGWSSEAVSCEPEWTSVMPGSV